LVPPVSANIPVHGYEHGAWHRDKPPAGLAHPEQTQTAVRAPVDARDRFCSFSFRPPTLVPGVQNYCPERRGKPRLI
jgi:hypothetical protein